MDAVYIVGYQSHNIIRIPPCLLIHHEYNYYKSVQGQANFQR